MKNLRIVFMGTPEFAVSTLGSLLMNGLNVVAVVTTPDKQAGRGRKLRKSAVREFAEFSYLPVLQPGNLKDPDFIKALEQLKADLFIVVAFRMLPEVVWRIPSIGTINLHASLLPQYRGAAPINHVIINGETVTGVTTFFIDDKIDTGNILMREELHIFPFENAGDLHDRLMKHGARLVIRTIEAIAGGSVKPIPQSELIVPGETIKTAPKITPDFCIINWDNEPAVINNFIRGLAPYPCARSYFVGRKGEEIMFKVHESLFEEEYHDLQPGDIVAGNKKTLRIACKKGFIDIVSLQPEGKRKMNADEFLRGFDLTGYNIKAD
ncbi:MAG TPA: methionyl-tRNA formyltransferase [Bacteroidales bacterium]|nr:methionyl-tRNA formyltransferase [Bacteroidales bacterium]